MTGLFRILWMDRTTWALDLMGLSSLLVAGIIITRWTTCMTSWPSCTVTGSPCHTPHTWMECMGGAVVSGVDVMRARRWYTVMGNTLMIIHFITGTLRGSK